MINPKTNFGKARLLNVGWNASVPVPSQGNDAQAPFLFSLYQKGLLSVEEN